MLFNLINLLLSKCSVFDFTMAMISAPWRHSSQLGGVALLLGRLRPRVTQFSYQYFQKAATGDRLFTMFKCLL